MDLLRWRKRTAVVLGVRGWCSVADGLMVTVSRPPARGCDEPVGLVVEDLLADITKPRRRDAVFSGGTSGDGGTHDGRLWLNSGVKRSVVSCERDDGCSCCC